MAAWHLNDYLDDVSGISDRVGERTIAFFDAVMAIAITLLILEIAVPEAEHFTLETAAELFVPITAFFISFNVLGQLWLLHTRACSLPGATGVCSPQLHLPLMLVVVLFPKTTELIATYPHSPLAVGIYLGCAVLLVALMALALHSMMSRLMEQYRHAYSEGSRIKISFAGLKQAAAEYSRKSPSFGSLLDAIESLAEIGTVSMAIGTVATVGSALFLFINPWICYIFFALDIVSDAILRRRSSKAAREVTDIWKNSPELQKLKESAKTNTASNNVKA